MIIRLNKRNFSAMVGVIVYRLLLDYLYEKYLSLHYSYAGFTYEFSIVRLVISWIILLIPLLFVSFWLNRLSLSDVVLCLLFCMAYVPFTTYYAYKEVKYLYLYCVYWFFLITINELFPRFSFKEREICFNDSIISALAITLVCLNTAVWVLFAKMRVQISLLTVYSARMEARTYNYPAVVSYMLAFSKASLPCFAAYYIMKKNKRMLLFVTVGQIISFFIDGSKSALFSIVIVLIATNMLKNTNKYFYWIPHAFIAISLLAVLECIMTDSFNVLAIFIRRVLFVPQFLNDCYYDFFSSPTNPFDYFRRSILRRFGFVSPYSIDIPFLIGQRYFNSIGTSANNGLFSDAYYNLGVIGMIVMPFLICLSLRLLEACMKGKPLPCALGCVITFTLSINSSSFFTVMLTHGFLVNCLVLYLMPKFNINIQNEINSYE